MVAFRLHLAEENAMNFDIARAKRPGFLRRLAAMVYDLVLLFGVLMLAVLVVIVPYGAVVGEFPHQELWHRFALQLYLMAVIGLYFVFFWVRGGQTLGMRSWRLRLLNDDGSPLHPRAAVLRLVWAVLTIVPLGVGFFWMLFDRDGLTLYDRFSRTRPVMVKRG